jgi:hypothetical protein
MSMGSELMDDLLLAELERDYRVKNATTWTTREGVKMNIVDMETSHIENTIKMLHRNDIAPPSLMYRVLEIRAATKGNK